MRSFNMNLSLSSFHLFLFMFIGGLRADFQPLKSDPLIDIACALVNCGQGTCKPSNATLLPFDCECYDGWKKIQIGSLAYPSCVVPDCTLNLDCDKENPPPPPPPTNVSDSCGLTWCGDGSCVKNGSKYICQCNEGSTNLLNLTDLACFKPCYFGADCYSLGFGPHPSSPPPPPPLPPPSPSTSDPTRNGTSPAPPSSPDTSDPTKNGPSDIPNSSRTRQAPIMLLLAVIFLSLFSEFEM